MAKNWFGSVSDDKTFALMDLRNPTSARPAITFKPHDDAVNTLAFHPKFETLLATGSADKTVVFSDLRFPGESKIQTFEGHHDMVHKVEWHPHDSGILASSSADRRIIFWDLSKVGAEQSPEDAEDGPPEMYVLLHLSWRLTRANMTLQALHAWRSHKPRIRLQLEPQ